jgi:hypothetical protein
MVTRFSIGTLGSYDSGNDSSSNDSGNDSGSNDSGNDSSSSNDSSSNDSRSGNNDDSITLISQRLTQSSYSLI